MKTVKIIAVLISFFLLPQFLLAQGIAFVKVGFPDGLIYYGNELGRTATTIKVQFIPSRAIYEFDKSGNILSSNGKYAAGGQVNLIVVDKYLMELTNRESMQSTTGQSPFDVGVVFGDGQLYYGAVVSNSEAGWFSITFYHSGSQYTMHREDGTWKVWSTDKGTYPKGEPLSNIFEVGDEEFYYMR